MILPILFFLAFFQIFIEIGRRYYEKALESKEEDALYKLIFKLYQLMKQTPKYIIVIRIDNS